MYSQRTLTYEYDFFDAFRAILTRSPFITFWGFPVIPTGAKTDPGVGLALGLLWVRRLEWTISRHLPFVEGKPRTRRPGFPSWSWTRIVGEIYNEGYGPQSIFEG